MKRHRGFALMMAVFIVVTLAAIGGYLLTVSTSQLQAASQDERAARAYQAARAGIEWAAYRVLIDGTCGNAALTLADGFSAAVSCAQVGSEAEGTNTILVFLITSTGCDPAPCGTPSATYVERELELTLAR